YALSLHDALPISDGQLGGEPEMMDALETGTVDIAMVGVPLVAQHCAALGMNALPYVIQGDDPEEQYENLQKITDSELHQQAVEECAEETGYRVIDASWWYGNRELTSNKEIHSVADMKGLKVRTPEGSLHSKPFEVLGADPVPMAQDEVYTALETGVIDAQENPFATIAKFSFEDVQDYLVLTSLMTHNQALVMWEDTYQDLSEDQQEALLSAVDEAGQWQSEEQLNENAELRDKLEENGIEIIEPDLDEFTEATRDFVEEYFDDNDLDFEEYLAIQECFTRKVAPDLNYRAQLVYECVMTMTLKKLVENADRALAAVLSVAAGLLIMGLIMVVTVAVILRASGNSAGGSNELTQLLLLWTVSIGAGLGARSRDHLAVEALLSRVSPSTQRILRIAGLVIAFIFLGVLTVIGPQYALRGFASSSVTPSLGISRGWGSLALPVAALLIILYVARDLILAIRTKDPKKLSDEMSDDLDIELGYK